MNSAGEHLLEIRSQFPAFERRQQGVPVAYFDGPGGTQTPRCVVEAMADYLYHHNANRHWPYAASVETDQAIDGARMALADFLNASPQEIIFGANMTSLTFHLARALGRRWMAGDEIIVTELDHHANIDPWRDLEHERGVRVRSVRMIPETGQLDWDNFEQQVNPKTRLVALGVASNALGTVNDVLKATHLAHAAGAWIFVDAVHSAPHILPDVRALGCDFLVCSAYKFYGPHLGALFARRELLASIQFPKLAPAPDTAPARAETGTQNHECIVGAGAAVDFLASLGAGPTRRERLQSAFALLDKQGRKHTTELWEGLSRIPGVTLYGPPPASPRTPTVSFTVRGQPSSRIARQLGEAGLFLSSGNFYAQTVTERLGLAAEGLVRAGCACYTTTEEIERLVNAVGAVARGKATGIDRGQILQRGT
ncbi:MAG: cysteine desulfurase-like protein [Terriglobia bacterium]